MNSIGKTSDERVGITFRCRSTGSMLAISSNKILLLEARMREVKEAEKETSKSGSPI